MGVVCKQPTTTCGKSNILTSKWANVGSSASGRSPSMALASVKGGREKKEKGGKGGKEKERGKKEKINAS